MLFCLLGWLVKNLRRNLLDINNSFMLRVEEYARAFYACLSRCEEHGRGYLETLKYNFRIEAISVEQNLLQHTSTIFSKWIKTKLLYSSMV